MVAAFGFLLAAAVSGEPTPVPQDRPRLQVVAHVEPGVAIDRRDLDAIAVAVRKAWRPYADVLVVTPDDTRRLVSVDEIDLSISNGMLPDGHGLGLGWIEFVDGRPQRAITVSMQAAARLMREGAWRGQVFDMWPPIVRRLFVQRALARAVAHEVGHYLLRSREHSATGMMRAKLSVADIMDRRPGDDRLAPADEARLRSATPSVARAAREVTRDR